MTRVEQRRIIHHGAKFDFEQVTLRTAGAGPVQREMIRHPGAVVIVPVLGGPEHRLVLIRNHRFTVEKVLWEFPAGTLEPPEPPEACAARELEEEAGYRAERVVPVGAFYTTPGMTDELMRAYVADGLTPVGQRLMDDEEISTEAVPLRRVLAMIDSGELMDSKSCLALWLAMRRGLVPREPESRVVQSC